MSKLNLFISYCHLDDKYEVEFETQLAPLEKELINIWNDKKIIPGQDLQNNIDINIDNADIICLLISANYLKSETCMKEKKRAFELNKTKNTAVASIIVSKCGWLDDKEIPTKLVLPKDGNSITSFPKSDEAWDNVYMGIKKVIDDEIKEKVPNNAEVAKQIITGIPITEEFHKYLLNTELLSNAHSEKTTVSLDDIFIYPDLIVYKNTKDLARKENFKHLIEHFRNNSRILIAGDNQSGKTTLCKKMFLELHDKKYIPIYLSFKQRKISGKIENHIAQAFKEQYRSNINITLYKNNIILIIDDFHITNNRERYINELKDYPHQIIMVDDILKMNFKDGTILTSYRQFWIKDLNASQRYELIKKWISLSDKNYPNDNILYKELDQKTDFINASLGKFFGRGIMPAHPFYILTLVSNYEAFNFPLNEITSQGVCYQTLIYLYLHKQNIKSDEMEIYINYLTVLAFYLFKNEKSGITSVELDSFNQYYTSKYNLPIEKDIVIDKLESSQLLHLDNFGNYTFLYSYLYYYFVAKYIADHFDDVKDLLNNIVSHLYKYDNAYIAIFINHHTKNNIFFDEILYNAFELYNKSIPTSLDKDELAFFDQWLDTLIKEVLPEFDVSPEIIRQKRMEMQELQEELNRSMDEVENDDAEFINLRQAIKSVEVMGQILKNRAGSLEREKLIFMFEEAMNIYLRILGLLFDTLKKDDLIEIILQEIEENKADQKDFSTNEIRDMLNQLLPNMCFITIYAIIQSIIQSLGSDKLISIVEEVCNKINTPASFLIKHGIYMRYNKILQLKEIIREMDKPNFSEISKKIMRLIIINHASMHALDYKERQKISELLNIPTQNLLLNNMN